MQADSAQPQDQQLTTQLPLMAQDTSLHMGASVLETLQPHKPQRSSWRCRGGSCNNRRNGLLEREIRNDLLGKYKKEEFKKHHIVEAINGQNLAETDTISANEQIEAVLLGKPKKIVETRAGFLAIEVRDKMQSNAIYSLRWQNGVDVEVKADDDMANAIWRHHSRHTKEQQQLLSALRATFFS